MIVFHPKLRSPQTKTEQADVWTSHYMSRDQYNILPWKARLTSPGALRTKYNPWAVKYHFHSDLSLMCIDEDVCGGAGAEEGALTW